MFFRIRQKDPKILYLIKDWLGFGGVYLGADGYYTYSASSKLNIKALIVIFNGKLILSKTNDRFVTEWLENYNSWFKTNITYKGSGTFVGLDNAWLCGFTDADGSLGFKVTTDRKRKLGCRVRVYWYVDQSNLTSKLDFDHIRSVLGMGYIEEKKPSEASFQSPASANAYRLTVMSVKDCKLLQRYFSTFVPQTTSKRVRFIRWNRVLNWCLDRTWSQHLDEIKNLIRLNLDI